jgi:hypothetical protein
MEFEPSSCRCSKWFIDGDESCLMARVVSTLRFPAVSIKVHAPFDKKRNDTKQALEVRK